MAECICSALGKEDSGTTCWTCHNCQDGSCTHMDGDDGDGSEFDFEED